MQAQVFEVEVYGNTTYLVVTPDANFTTWSRLFYECPSDEFLSDLHEQPEYYFEGAWAPLEATTTLSIQ